MSALTTTQMAQKIVSNPNGYNEYSVEVAKAFLAQIDAAQQTVSQYQFDVDALRLLTE